MGCAGTEGLRWWGGACAGPLTTNGLPTWSSAYASLSYTIDKHTAPFATPKDVPQLMTWGHQAGLGDIGSSYASSPCLPTYIACGSATLRHFIWPDQPQTFSPAAIKKSMPASPPSPYPLFWNFGVHTYT